MSRIDCPRDHSVEINASQSTKTEGFCAVGSRLAERSIRTIHRMDTIGTASEIRLHPTPITEPGDTGSILEGRASSPD